jgi:hypothetical protein
VIKIGILTMGSRGDVQPYVALGEHILGLQKEEGSGYARAN